MKVEAATAPIGMLNGKERRIIVIRKRPMVTFFATSDHGVGSFLIPSNMKGYSTLIKQ
jgi:hypothetical protein